MEIFVAWIAFSILAGVVASKKGRSGFGFFMLSVLLSPLIGLIAAFVAAPNRKTLESEQVRTGDMRKCPHCAELIRREAVVCRFCGRDVPPAEPAVPSAPAVPVDTFKPSMKAPLITVLAVVALIALVWGAYRYMSPDTSSGSSSVAEDLPLQKRLAEADENRRFLILRAVMIRDGRACQEMARAFFQGADQDGKTYWSVTCQNESFSVQVNNDSAKVSPCSDLNGSYEECFRPLGDALRKR